MYSLIKCLTLVTATIVYILARKYQCLVGFACEIVLTFLVIYQILVHTLISRWRTLEIIDLSLWIP